MKRLSFIIATLALLGILFSASPSYAMSKTFVARDNGRTRERVLSASLNRRVEGAVTSSIVACSGYKDVASYISPAGNWYHTDMNVCNVDEGNHTWRGVSRAYCYRNYDNWSNGCRWDGRVALRYSSPYDPWYTTSSERNYHYPSTTYAFDLGRQYTAPQFYAINGVNDLLQTWDDWGGAVRIRLADGTNRLLNMEARVSEISPDTP